jgi:peptidoglycan/xylan/chitin deacetylase (PgdA/CDA1 family)
MKNRLLSLLNTGVASQILKGLEALDKGGNKLLRVLTYHRVDEVDSRPELSPSLLSATPAAFEKQMHFIREHYQPVSIEAVLAEIRGESSLPEGAILISFDDAYCDFREQAWPILQKYEIPAILFVATGFPDQAERIFWWDRMYHAIEQSRYERLEMPPFLLELRDKAERKKAYKELRNYVKSLPHEAAMDFVEQVCQHLELTKRIENHVMSWDEIRKLVNAGLSIGAHSRNHPMLNRISLDAAAEEARNSLDDLRKQVSNVPPVFAYPSGGANAALGKRLGEEGFELAFTTERGINILGKTNPLLLRRINVGGNSSVNILRMQLLRSVGSLQELKN